MYGAESALKKNKYVFESQTHAMSVFSVHFVSFFVLFSSTPSFFLSENGNKGNKEERNFVILTIISSTIDNILFAVFPCAMLECQIEYPMMLLKP